MFRDYKAKKWITSSPILAAFNALHFKSFMDKTSSGFCQSSCQKSPNKLPRTASRGHPQVANCSFKNVLSLIKATTATVVHTQQHKNKGHTKAQRFQRLADRVTQRDRTLTSPPLLSPLLLLLFCLFYSFPSCTLFLTPRHSPEHSVQIHLYSPRRPLGTGVHSPRCPILCVFVRVQYACVWVFCVYMCIAHTITLTLALSFLCAEPGGTS